MGSLTKAYKADPAKETEGVWLDIAVNDDKTIAKMRILRMGQSNKNFTKRYATLGKKLRFLKGNKQEMENRALREAFVETCLVDWQFVENINEPEDGKEKQPYMPFNRENALKLFETLPELFDYVAVQAAEIETFQAEVNEAEAKNSFPSLSTT